MVSHDIILPTQEPSQFDICFYWILSLLFVFLIHIPIIIIMATQNFDFIRIIWDVDHYEDYQEMFKDDAHQMGILISILFIIPTIITLGSVVLLLILKIIGGILQDGGCGGCKSEGCMIHVTASIFWCLFSKQYFEVVAIHRGQDKTNQEPNYYSSFLSFKKKRKSTDSLLNGALGHQGIPSPNSNGYHTTKPKEPPNVTANILSLRDSFVTKTDSDDAFAKQSRKRQKKKHKHKHKKQRNQSVNSDNSQELQQSVKFYMNIFYLFFVN